MVINRLLDCIVAIATPPGRSAIAVIRVSGKDCLSRVLPFLSIKNIEPNNVRYAVFKDIDVVDDVLVSFFKSPKSFTGEDILEISCHGNYILAKKILSSLFKIGIRSAFPGEFSLRALLNGKIDLAQAESIIDIIDSKTNLAIDYSNKQLHGILSDKILKIRQNILDLVSHIEVHIDYPDEEELFSNNSYKDRIEDILLDIDKLLFSFTKGKIIKEGITVSIVGKPNVGKSSFLNKYLSQNRALVSDIAGTTRDTVEEWVELDGVPIKLVDTAGIRSSSDVLEKMGIEKTVQYIKNSQIVIAIFSADSSLDDDDQMLLKYLDKDNTIFLVNKNDIADGTFISKKLNEHFSFCDVLALSVKNDNDLEKVNEVLSQKINLLFQLKDNFSEILINNERHKEKLLQAKESIIKVQESIENNFFVDLWVMDLREAILYLGQIVGKDVSEEILDNIFSRFCVGK
jgi:tRNA modification GTPase